MKKTGIIFLGIILLAIILRVVYLDKVPPSLFGDEIDVGYQAYSLIKTGRDLSGNSWPILVHSLAEYRAPLFIYSAIPFVGIFGLNEWGVRLTAVFWGIVGIIGIYLLTKRLFDEKLALLSALFLTLSPWHIHYSRAGFEVTMLLAFIIFGCYFFILGLKNRWFLLLAAIFFGLTPYIYSTAVVFMPLLVIFLSVLYRKQLTNKFSLISLMVLLIILTPYVVKTFDGKAGQRFSTISIFTDQAFNDKYDVLKRGGFDLVGEEKIFYNKPIVWLQIFTLNYLRSFSTEFLLTSGDPNIRQSVHEIGQIYYFEIVPLLIGIFLLIKKVKKENYLVLGWLLIAPIPAALTYDGGFHATRNFLMLPALGWITSFGWRYLIDNFRIKYLKFLILGLLIIALFNFSFYLHRYFINYPRESWIAWNYGFKEPMQYISQNGNSYSRVLINNTYEPSLIRFLFWTKYDPAKFQEQYHGDSKTKNITSGFDGFSIDNKYFFGKLNKPTEEVLTPQDLYIASVRDDISNPNIFNNSNLKLLKTIYSPSNQPIFYIISGK